MPIIAVVRPGSTDFDVQNRIQGNLDLPLNDDGRGQLSVSIEQLAAWPLESVCAAPIDPEILEFFNAPVGKFAAKISPLCMHFSVILRIDDIEIVIPGIFPEAKDFFRRVL